MALLISICSRAQGGEARIERVNIALIVSSPEVKKKKKLEPQTNERKECTPKILQLQCNSLQW